MLHNSTTFQWLLPSRHEEPDSFLLSHALSLLISKSSSFFCISFLKIPYKPFRLEDCIMQFSYACTSNGSSLYRRYFRFNACSFPSDVLPNIFSYCDATTLSSCVAGVCREWKQYSEADDLWEHLCRTTFGVSVTQIANCTNAKELYILSHQQLQHICALRGSHIGSGGASIPTVIPMTIPIL